MVIDKNQDSDRPTKPPNMVKMFHIRAFLELLRASSLFPSLQASSTYMGAWVGEGDGLVIAMNNKLLAKRINHPSPMTLTTSHPVYVYTTKPPNKGQAQDPAFCPL